MKMSLKNVVAATLVAGAAFAAGAAQAATINNLPSTAGGSSLVLFLKNTTDGTFYTEDLGVQTSALRSQSALAADGVSTYSLDGDGVTGPLNVPASLNGHTSANLTAYLNGNGNDSIQWTILGANSGGGTLSVGDQTFAFTSTLDQLNSYWDSTGVNGARAGTQNFFVADINNSTITNGVSSSSGWGDSTDGANAPISFKDLNHANGAALGAAQTLYMVATSGAGNGANTYASQYTLTLSKAGVLSYDAPAAVPVPAAIWLLGSGLMGLMGIGRRRNAAQAA